MVLLDVFVGFRSLVAFAIAGISILTLVGFLNRFWYIFDIACQFRIQYSLSLAILAVLSLLVDAYSWACLAVLMALCNMLVVMPLFIRTPSNNTSELKNESTSINTLLNLERPQTNDEAIFSLLIANVLRRNRDYSALLNLITEYEPDFIGLVEPDQAWVDGLSKLAESYPYQFTVLRTDNYGLAVFSKYPIQQGENITFGEKSIPTLFVKIQIRDIYITLLLTHPPPPRSQHEFKQRGKHLSALAALVRNEPEPILLCGDFNSTPWTHSLRNLVKFSGLVDSSRGYGYQPSWPAGRLWMGVPIDHCLVSPSIKIVERRILRPIGSDHLPLFVRFTPTNSHSISL